MHLVFFCQYHLLVLKISIVEQMKVVCASIELCTSLLYTKAYLNRSVVESRNASAKITGLTLKSSSLFIVTLSAYSSRIEPQKTVCTLKTVFNGFDNLIIKNFSFGVWMFSDFEPN